MIVTLEVVVDEGSEVVVGLVKTKAGKGEGGDGEQNCEDGAED